MLHADAWAKYKKNVKGEAWVSDVRYNNIYFDMEVVRGPFSITMGRLDHRLPHNSGFVPQTGDYDWTRWDPKR